VIVVATLTAARGLGIVRGSRIVDLLDLGAGRAEVYNSVAQSQPRRASSCV
jgi:hypothetical protein